MNPKPHFVLIAGQWVETNLLPGPQLHLRVRTGFLLQGTSLTEWCRSNGTHISNARGALLGTWNGPKGKAMRNKIIKAARIENIGQQVAAS